MTIFLEKAEWRGWCLEIGSVNRDIFASKTRKGILTLWMVAKSLEHIGSLTG